MLKGLGDMAGIAKAMKAAQEMQGKMAELQERLAQTVVIGEAGAGLVKARCTGKGEVTGLEIDPSILMPSEKEVIEDLILAAIRDAQRQSAARSQIEMQKMAEGMGLPSDFKLPF